MKRLAFVFASVIALNGCQSSSTPMTDAQRTTDQISRCEMMGAKTQDQMFRCRLALERDYQQSKVAVAEVRQSNRSAALTNFGNSILTQQAMQQSRMPRTTSCSRLGMSVVCNTY